MTEKQISETRLSGEIYWDTARCKTLFITNREYSFILSNGDAINIPPGYKTDFRSCPNPADRKTIAGKLIAWIMKKLVELVVAQIGKHNVAVLIHDYLYTHCNHIYTRKFSDKEMLHWLAKCGVKNFQAKLMYYGVRIGGKSWWDN